MHKWTRLVVLTCAWTLNSWAGISDWPMLGHDASRSGATPTEVRPPFERKWYRLFTDEGILSGVQPIVADGKVFVGTMHGTLHAINADTGKDAWVYQAPGAILHTAAWSDGKVFFGCADGAVRALQSGDGKLVWEVQTGSAIWNAPAVADGVVFIGSRDQQLYAIQIATGNVLWAAPTGGPLLGSPAVDAKAGRVYIGSEVMCVYAFSIRDGAQVWKSAKLPGVSMRGYHPVIAPDGSVLITTAPGVSVDTFQNLLVSMAKEIFNDFASWRHTKEANDVLREENFALMQKPETYARQLDYIRTRLAAEPALQTFFVLDPKDGRQRFIAPIVYSESMNGPGAPALVSNERKVIVKFQALLRSRYEHYSPFLNVGELDTVSGDIRPIMDQGRTYGWHDSLLLVHDEQCQLSLGGHVLINTHQDNVNGFDLKTLDGFEDPFCRNLHEPKPEEILSIWTHLLRHELLPPGKEWLPRGTAVYGGGSVLDTAVSIAGDSFYYVPTHELNAGVAVIAYRMTAAPPVDQDAPLKPETLTADEWKRVQDLPWDWDTMEFRRLDPFLEGLPGKVPGTRPLPLTNRVTSTALADSDLDRVIWEARSGPALEEPRVYVTGLKRDLGQAVKELVSQVWQPLVFPAGKFPEEAYRLFTDPSDTLLTLAFAYPHLRPEMQAEAKAYVANLFSNPALLSSAAQEFAGPSEDGAVRSFYDPPPDKLLKFQPDIQRIDLARLYPVWLWCSVAQDWGKVEWPKLQSYVQQRPGRLEDDCRNGYLAGLIAYCRLADHMHDPKAVDAGVAAARAAFQERLQFEQSYTRGGVIWPVPKMRALFSRWHFLTPEVGRFLHQNVAAIEGELMDRYVEYHRPTWWLAWDIETMMRNESPYEFPSVALDVFNARSLVLEDSPEKLALFIDRPWCHADLFYMQKLALTIDAAEGRPWVDVRAAGR